MSNSDDLRRRLRVSAARIVCEAFGEDVDSVEWITQGVMTHKCVVRTRAEQKYVVRFYPSTRSGVVEYEPDVLRRATTAGVRVPEVVEDSRRGPAAELHYIVYKWIVGHPLSAQYSALTSLQRGALGREMVVQFDRLLQVEFAGYGDVIDGRRAGSATWAGFIEAAIRDGVAAVKNMALLPSSSTAALGRLAEQIPEILVAVPPRLVWADVSPGNVLVNDDGRLEGLIDFEGVLSGDGLLALGYCQSLFDRRELLMDLAHAWSTPLGPAEWRRIDLYAVVRALRNAPFYVHPLLPTGGRRSPLPMVYPGLEPAIRRLTNQLFPTHFKSDAYD
jgi:aminoglycoside phosphotransferase (APT) family kinase protein